MLSPSSAHRSEAPPSTTSTRPLPSSSRACICIVAGENQRLSAEWHECFIWLPYFANQRIVFEAFDCSSLAFEFKMTAEVSEKWLHDLHVSRVHDVDRVSDERVAQIGCRSTCSIWRRCLTGHLRRRTTQCAQRKRPRLCCRGRRSPN